jgi:tetratricopeptide (TPR) repeat protein
MELTDLTVSQRGGKLIAMSAAETKMLFNSYPAWIALILAIPSVSFAQQPDVRDWDAVERRYLQALDVASKAQSDQSPALYRIYLSLATLYDARHQYTAAEKYFKSTYDVAKDLFGAESEEVGKALNHLGEVRLQLGRIPEADGLFHQALKILEAENGASKTDTASVWNNLAVVQHMTGNLSKAAGLMRKVVEAFEADPSANQEGFGTAVSNLATMLREVGTLPEAMAAAQKAVSILEGCNKSDSLAVGLVTLSRLHLDGGDPARAEAMLQRALKTSESLGTEDTPTRALIYGHMAVVYGNTGKHREAESYFQRSIDINRRLLGGEHPRLLDSMSAYADYLRTAKRKGEAKQMEAYVREQREKYRTQNPTAANVVDVRSLMKERKH